MKRLCTAILLMLIISHVPSAMAAADCSETSWNQYVKNVKKKMSKDLGYLKARRLSPVVASFDINHQGAVENLRLSKSSGKHDRDQEALWFIKKHAPFAALPACYEGDVLQMEYHFDPKFKEPAKF